MAVDLIKPEDYKGKSSKFPMPNGRINPESKKKKEFYYAAAQSIFANWVDGNFMFGYGQAVSIDELWKYAKGRQSMDKIKNLSTYKKSKNGRPLTKQNISWEGYAKLPQMFDVVRSKNMSQEYDLDLYCVDHDSVAAKERQRDVLKYILDEETKNFVSRAQFKPNFQIDPERLGLQSQQEVDDFFDAGQFTLEWEIAAIAAVQKSKTESNYKEFQDICFDNLIINRDGFCGARTYVDKSDGIPKVRNIEAKNAICPYFKGLDSKGKIMRAGEVMEMTLGDIAKANPSFTTYDLIYIAKQYAWMNPDYASLCAEGGYYNRNTFKNYTDDSIGIDPVFNVKVLVLDYQFICEDVETYLKNDKREIFKDVEYGYKLDKKAEDKGDYIVEKNRLKRYEAMWIVGTKHFVHYGESNDVTYTGPDGAKIPDLDFHFVNIGNMSLVERAVAIVDDMNMALMKERNTWSTIPAAPAMLISKHMVENMFMNDKKIEPEELLVDFIERGIFYYDGLDEFGKPIYGVNGNKPFDFVNLQHILGMLTAFSNQMVVKVNELKELFGLQGGADGGAMDRYQGLGQTELAFEAANSSLAPSFNAYKYLFKNIGIDLIKKWQIKAKKQKDLKVPYKGLGSRSMKMLALSHPFSNSEFNAEAVIQPTMQERANLLADLQQLKAASLQTAGQYGITYFEYMFAYEKIMAGNIKGCMYFLGKIEAKKETLRRDMEEKNQQFNIQSQNMSAQTKLQGDLQLQNAKNQGSKEVATITELSKQITALTELILKGTKEGETRPNEQLTAAVIQSKEAQVNELLLDPADQIQQQASQEDQYASDFMADNGQGFIQ